MNDVDVQIMSVKSWDEEEILYLYKSAGWWKESDNKSLINFLIKNSCIFVIAVDKKNKKTVGMGRLLSDGVSDAYIQDVFVLEDYRELGIGKKLIIFLLEYCRKHHISWIGLISEPNQDTFYSKLGFKKMKNYVPMKYSGD